jgi:hypothetical protein
MKRRNVLLDGEPPPPEVDWSCDRACLPLSVLFAALRLPDVLGNRRTEGSPMRV